MLLILFMKKLTLIAGKVHSSTLIYQERSTLWTMRFLWKKLWRYGVRCACSSLLRSYLHDRTQLVCISSGNKTDHSDTVKITQGVPQRSILSPLLFIMWMIFSGIAVMVWSVSTRTTLHCFWRISPCRSCRLRALGGLLRCLLGVGHRPCGWTLARPVLCCFPRERIFSLRWPGFMGGLCPECTVREVSWDSPGPICLRWDRHI